MLLFWTVSPGIPQSGWPIVVRSLSLPVLPSLLLCDRATILIKVLKLLLEKVVQILSRDPSVTYAVEIAYTFYETKLYWQYLRCLSQLKRSCQKLPQYLRLTLFIPFPSGCMYNILN